MKTAQEIKDSLRKRTQSSIKDRDKTISTRKGAIDYSMFENITSPKLKNNKQYSWDIIPWIVGTDHNPSGVEKGDVDYELDYYIHRGIGANKDTYLCMLKTYGKPCFICEERQRLLDSGYSWDSKEVITITPSRRSIYNIIDLNEEEKGIQIFETSYKLFQYELAEAADLGEETIDFSTPDCGKTVVFRAVQDSWGKTEFFRYKNFSFQSRPEPYDISIIEESYPLDSMLIIPSYEEVMNAYLELDNSPSSKEEFSPDKEEEPERKTSSISRFRRPKTESNTRSSKRRGKEETTSPLENKQDMGRGVSIEGNLSCPEGYDIGSDFDIFPDDCKNCKIRQRCKEKNTRDNLPF